MATISESYQSVRMINWLLFAPHELLLFVSHVSVRPFKKRLYVLSRLDMAWLLLSFYRVPLPNNVPSWGVRGLQENRAEKSQKEKICSLHAFESFLASTAALLFSLSYAGLAGASGKSNPLSF